MAKIVACVTIDTEPDSGLGWKTRYPLSFESVTNGIPNCLRPIFNEHGAAPVYFVSPRVARNAASLEVLKKEIALGAEIGNHLHADELLESGPGHKKLFSSSDLSDEEEFENIFRAHEFIINNLSVRPTSFRGGMFGTDIRTIESLRKLGYDTDSSVTPGIDWSDRGGPDFRGYPRQPYFPDPVPGAAGDFKTSSASPGLLEVPVTIGGKRFPLLPDKWFLRKWLRPTIMTSLEMRALVREYLREFALNETIVLCMMFHSMEAIPGMSPYAQKPHEQKAFLKRLSDTLGFIRSVGGEFMTLAGIHKMFVQGKDAKLRTV